MGNMASPTPAPDSLETERLLLRRWRDDDREPFAAMNADPVVMEHFQAPLTRQQSDDFVDRIIARFELEAYGLWAVELRASGAFAGYVGLWPVPEGLPFGPVEVGWRLARHAWDEGYASEGARATVADGFGRLGIEEIVSFTSLDNIRSQRVMEKLGMTRDPSGDFDHPNVPEGHHLRRHVLYRLKPPRSRR
jgi:RimJ/RimL family protein N-acetyltransferase